MSDFEIEEKPVTTRRKTAPVTAVVVEEQVEPDETPESPEKPPVVVKPKFDQTELLVIFDTILFEGQYTESLKIRGKLDITFRSRNTKESWEITQKVDKLDFVLYQTVEQYRQIQFLAHSLIRYGTRDLSAIDLDKRIAFIDALPVSVTAILVDALSKFDEKVTAACKEAEENF